MQYDSPVLSVLVPAYNVERYISDTLQSLLKQTYREMEILVCDDGSSDQTLRIVREMNDSRIKVFSNPLNLGKKPTCQLLLDNARGAYVSVHDSDDISMPDRFAKQMNFLLAHPDYAMCGTNFISFLNNYKIIGYSSLETDSDIIREKIKKESQFHGPTVVFRKDVIAAVGGFYRYFPLADDIDMTMRIAERYKSTNLTEMLYLYRHVPSSLTNKLSGYTLERLGHAKLLYYLAEERYANNGIDSLMKGDYEKIDRLVEEFVAPFKDDPDIAARRGVFRLLPMHMYGNALKLAWLTMLRRKSMLNIKCFVYTFIHYFYGKLRLLSKHDKVDLSFLKSR